eukprot:6214791-Pleurochrysis_carterae.AAC.7
MIPTAASSALALNCMCIVCDMRAPLSPSDRGDIEREGWEKGGWSTRRLRAQLCVGEAPKRRGLEARIPCQG